MTTAPRSEETAAVATLAHPVLGALTAWLVGNRVGESPVWHRGQHALYWIDVRAQQVLRLCPDSNRVVRWALPDVVGAMALRGQDSCWLALRHALVQMDLHTGRLEPVCAVEPGIAGNRLNEGKASPSGRWFVFGSMDDRPEKERTGSLYRADSQGRVTQLVDGLVVANGIAWSPDGGHIYFSDSWRGLLMHASWDEATGDMGSPRQLATLDEARGRPDGACVTADGDYWSAGVSAGVLNRFDARGERVGSIALPCRAPTMCAFGGARAQTMFVTSLVRPQWAAPGPLDGALLSFAAPAPGVLQADLSGNPAEIEERHS